jgi:hypothetical protein
MKTAVHNRRLRALAAAALLAAALGAGCARTINDLLADPSRYRNRDIKLSGRVVDSYSVADRGAYRIADRTGELWVVSDRGVPRNGARVTVRGTVRDAFNLGRFADLLRLPRGASAGLVLLESSHKASR